MRRKVVIFSLLAVGAAIEIPVRADVFNLVPIKDNTLFQHVSGTLSNGSGVYLFVGRTGGSLVRRTLLTFDVVGSVPAGYVIQDATLTLYMSKTIVGPMNVSLHRVAADWGEATSDALAQEGMGGPAIAGDATWVHTFFNTNTWATPGGDFNPTPRATIPVDAEDPYTWGSTPEMVSDVQSWLDNPSSNFGWILVGDESTFPTAKRFNSREHPIPETHPVLSIVANPPAPIGRCCHNYSDPGNASCIDVTEAECNALPDISLWLGGASCSDADCVCPSCANNSNCNDNNSCTADTCLFEAPPSCGICNSVPNHPPTVCCNPSNGYTTPLNSGNPCLLPGTCNPATGQVTYPLVGAGVVCTDNNGCTSGDACDGNGSCVGTPINGIGSSCLNTDACGPGICVGGVCNCQPESCCLFGGACEMVAPGSCTGSVVDACLGDSDGNGEDDACAAPPVPTVSNWGLLILGLLILCIAKVRARGRQVRSASSIIS